MWEKFHSGSFNIYRRRNLSCGLVSTCDVFLIKKTQIILEKYNVPWLLTPTCILHWSINVPVIWLATCTKENCEHGRSSINDTLRLVHLKYLKGKIRQAPVVGVNAYVCTNYSLPLQYLLHEKKDLLHCTDISIVQITEKAFTT